LPTTTRAAWGEAPVAELVAPDSLLNPDGTPNLNGSVEGSPDLQTLAFTYDNLNRLLHKQLGGGSQNYTFQYGYTQGDLPNTTSQQSTDNSEQ